MECSFQNLQYPVMAFILQRSFVPSILQGNPVLTHSFYSPNSLVTSYNLAKIKQQQEAQHRRREEVLGELVQSFWSILSTRALLSGPTLASKGNCGLNLTPQVVSIPPSSPAPTLPLRWLPPWPGDNHSDPPHPVHLSKVGWCLAVFPLDFIIPRIKRTNSRVGNGEPSRISPCPWVNYQLTTNSLPPPLKCCQWHLR